MDNQSKEVKSRRFVPGTYHLCTICSHLLPLFLTPQFDCLVISFVLYSCSGINISRLQSFGITIQLELKRDIINSGGGI